MLLLATPGQDGRFLMAARTNRLIPSSQHPRRLDPVDAAARAAGLGRAPPCEHPLAADATLTRRPMAAKPPPDRNHEGGAGPHGPDEPPGPPDGEDVPWAAPNLVGHGGPRGLCTPGASAGHVLTCSLPGLPLSRGSAAPEQARAGPQSRKALAWLPGLPLSRGSAAPEQARAGPQSRKALAWLSGLPLSRGSAAPERALAGTALGLLSSGSAGQEWPGQGGSPAGRRMYSGSAEGELLRLVTRSQ